MKYWIWMTQITGVGPATERKLLGCFGDPKSIYEAEQETLEMVKGLSIRQIENILNARDLTAAEAVEADCEREGIDILTIADERFPRRMKEAASMPILLYGRGKYEEPVRTAGLSSAKGMREDMSERMSDIAEECALEDTVMVCGLSKNSDFAAHRRCLDMGGRVIAVLENGLNVSRSSEQRALMNRIAENGMLLTECVPGIVATKFTFPDRNRLIGALSDRMIVVGAEPEARDPEVYGKMYRCPIEFR